MEQPYSAWAIPGIEQKVKTRQEYDQLGTELTLDFIQQVVAEKYGVAPADLQIKTRKLEIREGRQVSMFFGHLFLKMSLASVGFKIGRKDHSTVLHAERRVRGLYQVDKCFRSRMNDIMTTLCICETTGLFPRVLNHSK
jgi:chromosomal replication initiation ATPase DnaA